MEMTEKEMMEALLRIFPRMTIEEDNDGQLIVYTDARLRNGKVIPYTED